MNVHRPSSRQAQPRTRTSANWVTVGNRVAMETATHRPVIFPAYWPLGPQFPPVCSGKAAGAAMWEMIFRTA